MVQVHRFLAVFLGPQCVPYAQDVLGALAACIGQVSQRPSLFLRQKPALRYLRSG